MPENEERQRPREQQKKLKVHTPDVKQFRKKYGWNCKECGNMLGTMSKDGHWVRIGDRAFTVNIYEAPLVVIVCRGCHSLQELHNPNIDGLMFEISRHLSDDELATVIEKINNERKRMVEQNEALDKIAVGVG